MRRPAPLEAAGWAAAAAAVAGSAWFVARDQAPPAWDDAWYLEVSFRLFHALKTGPAAFAAEWLGAFKIKAPLLSLTPLPVYALLGPSERAALWTGPVFAALGAWAWSRAAREWWRAHPRAGEIAALTAALVALTPVHYALSRRFLVETLLTALLGLWAWRCAAAQAAGAAEGPRLGALLGLGLLAKVTFPAQAAGAAWAARRSLLPRARAILLVGGGLAATWYAANLPFVLGFAWQASFGPLARDYASGAGLAARWNWALSVLGGGLGRSPAAALAAVLAAAWALSRRPRLDDGTRAALWTLAPLALYALGVNAEVRLAAPLLAPLAALGARAASSFDARAARAAAAGLLLGAGLWTWADQTFRAGPERALPYSGAPSAGPGWDRAALVAAARDAGATTVAVAYEDARLNANNLASLAAADGRGPRFVSLGYAQASAEGALIRLKDKGADALVLVDAPDDGRAPGFLNRANAGVAAAIASGRLPARAAAVVPLAPGVSARLYSLRRAM